MTSLWNGTKHQIKTNYTQTMSNEKFQNRYRIPSARANWHDYSCGEYFVTICTSEHEHSFGEITNNEMQLTEIGRYAEECVKQIEILHPDISVPLYVIMPNHIHLIIIIDAPHVETSHRGVSNNKSKSETYNVETPYYDVSTTTETKKTTPAKQKNEKMQLIANKCGRLSHIISRFKSAVTRYANENNISFKWQTRFHDRIIRNQNELNEIAQYIENNPYNWMADEYY